MLTNDLSPLPIDELRANKRNLAVLQFEPIADAANQDCLPTRVELIGEDANLCEAWVLNHEVTERGETAGCHWQRNRDLQYTSAHLALSPEDDYQEVAYAAYQSLLKAIKSSEHQELVRFWNYIPHINVGEGDSENYKRFCTGRLRAFEEVGLCETQFPAASAVGHYRDGISVAALTTTAKNAASLQHHANPRQVDAFKYPRQYGPSSPSFARATTVEIGESKLCFVSGTASILGHKSVHRGDLKLQLYTTNDNIRYLLGETGFKRDDIESLRVYLREQNDYEQCKKIVDELFPGTPTIFMHADICRSDLLVEIECHCVQSGDA